MLTGLLNRLNEPVRAMLLTRKATPIMIPAPTNPILAPPALIAWRRAALVCLTLAVLALVASIILDAAPMRAGSGLLPLAAAALGMVCGGICLFAVPAAAASEASASVISGLHAVVREMGDLLREERGKLASFQEVCAGSTREALAAGKRLAHLSGVAIDAEVRLTAGVVQADEAMRQPSARVDWAADAALRVERALPELAELIRRGAAEQSDAIAAGLDAAAARLAADTESPLQSFRAAVAVAAEQIAALGDNAAIIGRDAGAFGTTGRELLNASTTVVNANAAAVSRLIEAVGRVDAAAAQLPAATEQAAQTLAEASSLLCADGAALSAHGNAIQAALALLPAAAEALGAASEGAAQTITDASGVLRADSESLAASGREAGEATAGLRREAETMKAVMQALADAGQQVNADITNTLDAAAAHLAGVIADADAAREDQPRMAQLAAALEAAASTLLNGAHGLDAVGQRVAAAGESVAQRLTIDQSRSEAILRDLPEAAAEMSGAMAAALAAMGAQTAMLSSAARQVSAVGNDATAAVTGVVARVESVAVSLDQSGRAISDASRQASLQIGQLAELAGQAQSQGSLFPAASAQMEQADAAFHRLDALSLRLEQVARDLRVEPSREAALERMAGLSEALGHAMRRVEAVLADHEGAWPAMVSSIVQQVQSATAEVLQAAADQHAMARPGPPVDSPTGEAAPVEGGVHGALFATLRNFDGFAGQTAILLEQTEALAKAVLSGEAPGLPEMLAARTPDLLAGISTATRRLHSVATALALASDGVQQVERRRAGSAMR